MKSRIDLRRVLADPLHWSRIVLYVVIATVVIGALQHYVNRRSSQRGLYEVLNGFLSPLHGCPTPSRPSRE